MAEPLKRFLQSLNAAGVEYVVVGAHAVAFHGYPRATQDLDILYVQTEQNARRLTECVRDRVPSAKPEDLLGPSDEFAVVRFHGERVDLLPEIDGVSTTDVMTRAVDGILFGEPTRFISRDDLLTNKRATRRSRDAADVDELEKVPS